jgi:hypothetical protein
MVGLRAKVLGRLGRTSSPHPRACALSCPSLAIYGSGSCCGAPALILSPRPRRKGLGARPPRMSSNRILIGIKGLEPPMVRPWPSPAGRARFGAFQKHPLLRAPPASIRWPRRPTLLHFVGAAFALPRSNALSTPPPRSSFIPHNTRRYEHPLFGAPGPIGPARSGISELRLYGVLRSSGAVACGGCQLDRV